MERRTVLEVVVPVGIEPDVMVTTLEDAVRKAYGKNVKAYKRHLRTGPSLPPQQARRGW